MFRFATPGYLYLLLLLPLLAGLYVYAVRSRRRALERFADEAVLPGLMPEASPVRLRLKSRVAVPGTRVYHPGARTAAVRFEASRGDAPGR